MTAAKRRWRNVLWIVLAIIAFCGVVLAGCVLWYRFSEMKPFQECHEEAKTEAVRILEERYERKRKTDSRDPELAHLQNAIQHGRYTQQDYMPVYGKCLQKKGFGEHYE